MTLHLLILFTFCPIALSNNLFFGVTHSGKSATINAACGLNLPVAEDLQTDSTTKLIESYECLGSQVIDTIGVFDYRGNGLHLGVNEVLKIILDSISKTGLSSLLWVSSSQVTVGNHQLEEVFSTLRKLLPDVLPMAIVDNQFPGKPSGVPALLGSKFNLPILKSSLTNPNEVRDWIKGHTQSYRVNLPPDYEKYLLKHDINGLRSEMLKLSLLSCDVVKDQLSAITRKLNDIGVPNEQCKCNTDCRMTTKYCCADIIGICLTKCTRSYIDQACMQGVRDCYAGCSKAFGSVIAQTSELMDQLNHQFSLITTENRDLLKACDKFHMSDREL